MDASIPIKARYSLPFGPIIVLLLALLLMLAIWNIGGRQAAPSLAETLEKKRGVAASPQIYEAAILQAASDLAFALGVNLEDYNITLEQYEALTKAAAEKFGDCEQYRLLAITHQNFPCYTCSSKDRIVLGSGQTFKIGQTCASEASRYGKQLPEQGLKYFAEFQGNVFEVLVAEYIKLTLYRVSKERELIIRQNGLSNQELPLPPGNKILK